MEPLKRLQYTPQFDFRRPPATRGQCRWCHCTDAHGCEFGCHWVNQRHTLCSDCVAFDRLLRTRAGREYLIGLWHAAQLRGN